MRVRANHAPVACATSRTFGAPLGCGGHGVGKEPGAGSPVHTRGGQKRLDANEPGTSVQMLKLGCVFKSVGSSVVF